MNHHDRAALALAMLCFACASATGQAASTNHVLTSSEQSAGGATSSTTYRLHGSLGAGVVAARTTSSTFVLRGGFVATLDASASGRPWLMAVEPRYAPLFGNTKVSLRGTELHLGSTASVKVGGLAATVGPRTRDAVEITVPKQAQPGWAAVEMTAAGTTTTLARGVGVLPMLDGARSGVRGAPLDLEYRGTQGDLAIWFVALRRASTRLTLAPIHHALELDLASLIVVTTTTPDHTGRNAVRFPAAFGLPPLYFQALVLTNASGYAPGSFTNVLEI
ncbi:MAG: hypothetical protein H6832_07985 [Planctomycetes bacterium]|nr:hypothetical protein [Planctomycetota bacterium]MCB9918328.1 hypothetical protein [Planctomycetota bacterium]